MMAIRRSTAALLAAGLISFARPAAAARPGAIALAPLANLVAMPVARRDLIDFGPAPASMAVRVAITLKYRNEAELEQLVDLQATPQSPLFHHYITPEQFAATFAPSFADYERVASSLRTAGFLLGPASANRTVIDAIASAPVAERYFSTQIHRVAQLNHGIRYANVTAATVPASIASAVSTVLGIDDIVKFKSKRVRAKIDATTRVDDGSSPLLSGPVERIVGGVFEGLYPTGIAKAYNYPAQSGFTGSGHAIAVVIDSDIASSDLSTFWKAAGITRSGHFNRVVVDSNPGVTADVGETAIDTETTTSLAPAADVYLYLISSLADGPIEDAYDVAVRKHDVDVVSSSFGGCELDDTPFSKATDAIAVQGASEGLSFTASSGDSGGYCEDATSEGNLYFEPDIVSNPASDPHFLAVGGTTLTINAKTGVRTSETAWTPGGADGGGGGGVSSYWARPSYQNGVSGIDKVPSIKVKPPDSQPKSGFAGRNVPDISLDASNGEASYIAVYDTPDGGWTGYGGTSVSNPCFAALLTEQNQQKKSLAGYADPALYSAFTDGGKKPGGVYGSEFHDITSGSIGSGWSARTGYDQATGIGSIFNGSL